MDNVSLLLSVQHCSRSTAIVKWHLDT